jgi:hypothetical protein
LRHISRRCSCALKRRQNPLSKKGTVADGDRESRIQSHSERRLASGQEPKAFTAANLFGSCPHNALIPSPSPNFGGRVLKARATYPRRVAGPTSP